MCSSDLQQYELIPGEHNFWKVRILEGEYIETVYSYGVVQFDEENHTIKFDFTLEYTPMDGLSSEDPDFQQVVSKILHSILMDVFDEHKS